LSDGFFLHPLSDHVAVGDVVILDGPEGHHAANVRRLRVGEIATVAAGNGLGIRGPVVEVGKGTVTITVATVVRDPFPEPRFVCVQALPKNDRAELTVDLLTELGVDEIVPWQASRSIVRWEGDRGERALTKWQAVAREASKQARRLTVPVVSPLATTREVADRLRAADGAYVLHESATTPVLALRPPLGEIVFVIGPEGGVSPDELATFEAAGAVGVVMGRTVLRTSTAGATAMTMLRTVAELVHWADDE
jgi:16S rRNA (uracil1498-N3)-methyltransferase